jgi:hypothetical protein
MRKTGRENGLRRTPPSVARAPSKGLAAMQPPASVIASEAKQSRRESLDCFVAVAPRTDKWFGRKLTEAAAFERR